METFQFNVPLIYTINEKIQTFINEHTTLGVESIDAHNISYAPENRTSPVQTPKDGEDPIETWEVRCTQCDQQLFTYPSSNQPSIHTILFHVHLHLVKIHDHFTRDIPDDILFKFTKEPENY